MKDHTAFGIKIVSVLFLLMFGVFALSFWSKSSEEKIIEEQLEAIEENRLTEAYYSFTSKEFQTATSLEDFKKFIRNFPLFSEDSEVTFDPATKPGEFHLTLKSDDEAMHLTYTLLKEGEVWRIKGIEVNKEERIVNDAPEFDTSLFLNPVKEHVEALKRGDYLQAYKQTAEDFQASTPFSEFEAFLKSFPILTQYKTADYYKLSFNNNLGMYHVKFVGNSGETYEAQYDLVRDKGKWKILQIQISDHPL